MARDEMTDYPTKYPIYKELCNPNFEAKDRQKIGKSKQNETAALSFVSI